MAALIGPALGTALFSARVVLPFLADAVSYLCSIVSLTRIKAAFQAEREPSHDSLLREIAAGLAWLWRQPLLRVLALLTGLINLVFPDTSALIVLVLARQQGVSIPAIGLIFSLASIGYLLGSLLSTRLLRRLRFAQIVRGACWLFALLWAFYLVSTGYVMLLVVTLLLSLIDPIYDVAQFSYRAAIIPDALQGRVNSSYRLLALSTPPLGYFLAGLLLQSAGAHSTILVFLACLLLLALIATLSRPIARSGQPADHASQPEEPAQSVS
jgi:hypothetical protein